MLAQELGKVGHQNDGSDCLRRLWLHSHGGLAAASWVELLANPNEPRVEVEVRPNEAEQLADAQPGEEGCCDQGSVVVGRVGEEAFDLLPGQDSHLAPLRDGPLATLEAADRVLRDRAAANGPVQDDLQKRNRLAGRALARAAGAHDKPSGAPHRPRRGATGDARPMSASDGCAATARS